MKLFSFLFQVHVVEKQPGRLAFVLSLKTWDGKYTGSLKQQLSCSGKTTTYVYSYVVTSTSCVNDMNHFSLKQKYSLGHQTFANKQSHLGS